jgi:hypothetical protein
MSRILLSQNTRHFALPLMLGVRRHIEGVPQMRELATLLTVTLLAACSGSPPPESSAGVGHVVHCTEPLPEFTLGPASQPTQAQEAALCTCVWEHLGSWERRTSEQIARGKESEASALNLRAFPARFGAAVKECGGMKL